MAKSPSEAKLEQVLLRYGDPEVLLLRISLGEYVLAVGLSSDEAEGDEFVGASISASRLRDYGEQFCDLRFAMSHAFRRRCWKFRYSEPFSSDTKITLSKISIESSEFIDSLPEPGFFARDHAPIDLLTAQFSVVSKEFSIDGNWEMDEFSNFYGEMSDVYHIVADIEKFRKSSTSTEIKNRISEAFNKPFRGGGSYVSFFRASNDNNFVSPLRVSGIQWNSPGFVKVKADGATFDDMISLLESLNLNRQNFSKYYQHLYNYLSGSKLLKKDSHQVVSTDMANEIIKRSELLEKYTPNVEFETLISMAHGNTLIAAKVLLSICRRIERLYSFFDEGRVAYDAIDVSENMNDASDD